MASRSERILVTGSSGFTGRPLVAALRAEGRVVAGLSHHAETPEDIAADISDRDAVMAAVRRFRPDAIAHLAAIALPGHPDLNEMFTANAMGTLSLLQAAAAAGTPPRFILASSAAVYAPPAGNVAIDEDHPLGPPGPYGASKVAAEGIARSFAGRVPVIVARPFNYTGPGQSADYLVPKIVDHVRRRAARIELGNVDIERDISDVAATVEAYRRLIDGGRPGDVLNLCSGRPLRLRSLVETACRLAGHAMEIVVLPKLVRAGEPRRIVGDPGRLHARVGAVPHPAIEETLGRMLAAPL